MSIQFQDLADRSHISLIKVAMTRKEAMSPETWYTLKNYGFPMGVGVAGAGAASYLGADPSMSAAYGAGLGAVASPKAWTGLGETVRGAAGDKVGVGADALQKLIIRKLKFPAIIAGLDYGPRILGNVNSATRNLSQISQDFSNQSQKISGGLGTTIAGLGQASGNLGLAGQSIDDAAKQLKPAILNAGKGVDAIGRSISKLPDALSKVPDAFKMSPTMKGLLGGGVALGGAGILLNAIQNMRNNKKKSN
jgi:hypothetical protein